MITFNQLMQGFGVVTVMNACIYEPIKAYTGSFQCCTVDGTAPEASGTVMVPSDYQYSGESLDTLKIANITQEGPTKTITGGQYNNTLVKYGKTATMEMQDALGRASTMVRFFGCDYDGKIYVKGNSYTSDQLIGDGTTVEFKIFPGAGSNAAVMTSETNYTATGTTETITTAVYDWDAEQETGTKGMTITFAKAPAVGEAFTIKFTMPSTQGTSDVVIPGSRLSVTDKFPGAFAIEGTTFFIDQKTGEKKTVYIFIPQFSPDAILTLTQDAEGDATVFDLNGTVNVTDVADVTGGTPRSLFYEIRETSFFAN